MDYKTSETLSSQTPADPLTNFAPWPSVMGNTLLLAMLVQWEWCAALQRAMGAAQQELMDEWKCRYGGGVPLDG